MKPSPLTALFDHNTPADSPQLTLVLGGGGARGAQQVGALRYLMEQGIQPDLVVGTSIGAVNATFLAVWGFTLAGLEALETAWHDAAAADLLPANYIRITARLLFNRVGIRPNEHRLRSFYIEHGLSPNVRYADLEGPAVIAVATDLNTLHPVLYGRDPNQSVLEGLMASTAVPPWIRPLDIGESFLMDGGVLSNLPIEPALQMGATDIIAMNLFDARQAASDAEGVTPFFLKLLASVELRQIEMELALAAERGVPVHHMQLVPHRMVPMWDFSETDELIARGYDLAREQMAGWKPRTQPWTQRLRRWVNW